MKRHMKRKTNARIPISPCILLAACVLMASVLTVACRAAATGASTSATTAITAGANQTLVLGRITDIQGNDVVLALAREAAAGPGGMRGTGGTGGTQGTGATQGAGGSQGGAQGATTASGQGTQAGQPSQGGTGGQGQGGQRQRPTGTGQDGQTFPTGQGGQTFPTGQGGQAGQRQRPTGGPDQIATSGADSTGNGTNSTGTSGATGANQGGQSGQGGQTRSTGTGSQPSTVLYTLTGETLNTRIPVGVKVITAKGAVTTFSRLAIGDMVKILMENSGGSQVPVGVWIVG